MNLIFIGLQHSKVAEIIHQSFYQKFYSQKAYWSLLLTITLLLLYRSGSLHPPGNVDSLRMIHWLFCQMVVFVHVISSLYIYTLSLT